MALPPVVRGAVRRLAAGFALSLAAGAMAVGAGSVAVVRLTGDLGSAGLYLAVYSLGAALGAVAAGRAMDRWGRRPALVAAYLLGAAGYLVAGVAVAAGAFPLFAGGVALSSFGVGGIGLTRVAAADMFPPARRAEAVSFVLVAATAGAIVGPLFLVGSDPLGAALGMDPTALVWFAAAPLMLLGGVLVAGGPEPLAVGRDLAAHWPGEPLAPAAVPGAVAGSRPALLAGVAAIALSLAAMASVMGVAGASLAHQGHGAGAVGATLTLHYLGMYAFALRVGKVADRIGRRATVLAGLVILAAGGAIVAVRGDAPGLAAGLFVIGLGWCFAYIGGTVLVTDVTPLARRARVLGAVDLGAALLTGGLAWFAGVLLAQRGLGSVGLLAVVLMLAPVVLAALLREPRPAARPRPE